MPLAPMRRAAILCALLAGGVCVARADGTGLDPGDRHPSSPVAIAAEVTSEGSKTRLTVSLSASVAAKASLMERPERVVIDLPEVNFQLPADAGRRREGVVASFRQGLFAPGRSRIVIDLAQPALVSRVETTRGADGAASLVIELTRTDKDAFRAAAAPAARTGAPDPPPAAKPREDRRPLIVIDPGHGGIDPGAATAGGVLEKDVVFAFAERLRDRLEASGLYRVTMTRRHDVFVPLDERVRIARSSEADLLLSIHADSISAAPHVRGFTVYTGAERASDAESAKLAERENQADAAGGIDGGATADEVADILQELTLRETRGFSKRAAAKLVGGLGAVMRLNAQPQREARFKVLRAADVPSVLVELGYLSSRKDIDLLTSASWRDRSTAAMAAAVDRFFAARVADRGRTATAARR